MPKQVKVVHEGDPRAGTVALVSFIQVYWTKRRVPLDSFVAGGDGAEMMMIILLPVSSSEIRLVLKSLIVQL